MGNPGIEQLEPAVVRFWQQTLWELRLEDGDHSLIVADVDAGKHLRPTDEDDELLLLHAEALSAAGNAEASGRWARVRTRSVELADSEPPRAARLRARHAVQLTTEGNWARAEEGFIQAATMLTRSPGNEEEAAEYFFSAQTVGRLSGELFPFKGWSWRSFAASLRSAQETPMATADRYLRAGQIAQAAGKHDDARRELSLGLAVHRRSGHLRGTMALTQALADVRLAAGELTEAALAYCKCAEGDKAKKAAARLTTSRELGERLPVGQREWETRASCAVLASIGRFTSPERAAELLPTVLEFSRASTEESSNTAMLGAEALSELCVALDDQHLLPAVERLCELLSIDHNALRRAGGEGLRMLVELERVDAAEALVIDFSRSPNSSSVWPAWVSERLQTPAAISAARDAALRGHPQALLAVGLAGQIKEDEALEAACTAYAQNIADSDLGRRGNAIMGLVAFNSIGGIVSYCPSDELRMTVAEKLLLYALETYWPVVNRSSAVVGTCHLAKTLDPADFVERLRPLADPESDLDGDSKMPFNMDMAVEGEFEAQALSVCVDLVTPDFIPSWLRDAAIAARVDPRSKMRAAAWRTASFCEELPVEGAVELAMADPEHEVRVAALLCWRKRIPNRLPSMAILESLLAHPFVESRRAVLSVAEQYGLGMDNPIVSSLIDDPDAYISRLAKLRFASGPSSSNDH